MAQKLIVLDPGHDQFGNRSPNNSRYIEGVQMWHLANKLKAALEGYGFAVLTTRPALEDNPTLAERGEMAGRRGASMFLSLHSNAPGRNADGTYSPFVTGSVIYYSMTGAENRPLADALGSRVSEIMGHYYRGSMTREYPNRPGVDYYGVIRAAAQSGCPCAMLIEHGFHTNLADAEFLLDDTRLQTLAEAEAAVIAEAFAMVMPPAAPGQPEEDALYRVQIGAYRNRANAEAVQAALIAAGFPGAFVVAVREKQ